MHKGVFLIFFHLFKLMVNQANKFNSFDFQIINTFRTFNVWAQPHKNLHHNSLDIQYDNYEQ